jgi:hypothetical protein
MIQVWSKLLFMHWRVPEATLRPLVPDGLHLDTYDGAAWIGVTPFTMPVVRPPFLPALPLVGRSHELNVRTYVHHDGVPGVWFLSLDAENPLAVLGARLGFSLPYYQARMHLDEREREIRFRSRRVHPGAHPAQFEGSWRRREALPEAIPGSLEFFLIERYCLYAKRAGRLLRTRIHHRPWPLCSVSLLSHSSTMLDAHGLSAGDAAPLLHGLAEPLEVGVWWPSSV